MYFVSHTGQLSRWLDTEDIAFNTHSLCAGMFRHLQKRDNGGSASLHRKHSASIFLMNTPA